MARRTLFIWFLVVTATFLPMAFMSMHTGDDLGYMFTDTVHHGDDGHRVTSLTDCVTTQMHHWQTTNGRFVVHVTVMALLNLVPLWLFRVLNSLVFGLLWLATLRLVKGKTPGACALTWLALWLCLPQPGLVMGTLVAYAVNYLWTLTAYAWWLVALRRPWRWWLYPLTFVLGTLHEGFGLPALAALAVVCIFQNRGLWRIIVPFAAGVALCVAAPGNFAHAQQGGGFVLDAVLRKCAALGFDLLISPGIWVFVFSLPLILKQKEIKDNIFSFTVILTAVAFAALTFTSPRQLTLPLWMCAVTGIRALLPRLTDKNARIFTLTSVTATMALICTILTLKYPVYRRYVRFMQQVQTQTDIKINPADTPNTGLPAWLRRAWAPDPLANQGLVTLNDRYTAHGLERITGHPVRITAGAKD